RDARVSPSSSKSPHPALPPDTIATTTPSHGTRPDITAATLAAPEGSTGPKPAVSIASIAARTSASLTATIATTRSRITLHGRSPTHVLRRPSQALLDGASFLTRRPATSDRRASS